MMRIVDDLEGFQALRPAWDDLYVAAGADNPFVTWSWLSLWVRHLAERFVVVVQQRAPDAPLDAAMLFDRHGRHWCTPTRESYFAQLLVRPGVRDPLRPFLTQAYLRGRARRVILHRSPNTDEFRARLRATLGPLEGLVVERGDYCSRYVDLAGGFEAYLAERPSKVRQELKRKDRAFAREVEDAHLVEVPAGADGGAAIEAIAHVEEDSWKEVEHTSISASEGERAFFAAVAQLAEPDLRARLFVLTRPAGPVAYVIGVEHHGVYHALKTSYRADHAKLSPGQVIFYRLLEHLAAEGRVRRVELLGVDQRWKRELSTGQRDERTYEILRPDPLNAAIALLHRHRDRPRVARTLDILRKVRARLRPSPQGTP